MKTRVCIRFLGLMALAVPVSFAISAASAVVGEGSGQRITVDDLNADALRLPAAARHQALQQPDAVQQAAQNLYVRRVLAAEAARDGLDKDPTTAALLQIARERVLSDARLAKIDEANKPDESAVEAAAKTAYAANPNKYQTGEQTRVRHILIAGNTEKGLKRAEEVLAEIKAGADFERVAREKSADTSNANRGGDLGWFEPGRMVPEFDEAVAKLKTPGELSELVRTQFGWHIIKLEGRRPGGQRKYEEVRDELRATVTNQLYSDARLREARRIAETFKPDRPAIEAYSAAHRK